MRRTNLLLTAVAALAWGCDDGASTPADPADPADAAAEPSPDGGAVEQGLAVEIVTDSMGVPHIYGETDGAAFYGAGYAMARDRLYQMDMTRRRALGRQSEVLGLDRLEDDKVARLFRWARHGHADAERMRAGQPETWALLEAWAAGVNRRIDEVLAGDAPLDEGFETYAYAPERWAPEDVVVIGKMTAFGNDLSLEFEIFATIARLLAPDAFDAVDLVRPIRDVWTVPDEDRPESMAACSPRAMPRESLPLGADLAGALASLRARFAPLRVIGSNNWAVSGAHTANGKPFIAGDPHQGFDFPGMFYALHINSADAGGSLDVAGFSFAGVPGISMGHTDSVAWTVTTNFADVMDIWSVEATDDSIIVGGETVPLTTREVEITVRNPGDAYGEGRRFAFVYQDAGDHGLLLPRDIVPIPVAGPGRELLFNWTGYRPRDGGGLIALNTARSVEDFEAAVDQLAQLNYNFLGADADDITYRVGVEIPKREVTPERAPWLVMDGDDAGSLWTGEFLEPTQKPRSRGTERGFLSTANNDPWGFTANGRLDDDPWYHGALFSPGWRAGRVDDRLTELVARGDVTFEDMRDVQLDLHSNLADDLLPVLEAEGMADDPEVGEIAARLLAWDREMRRDSPEALLFHAFAHFLTAEAIADDLGLVFPEAMRLQAVYILKLGTSVVTGRYENGDALLQEGRTAVVKAALTKTKALVEARFPDGDYTFADMRVSSFLDSFGAGLDYGTIATDGAESTVNVAPSSFFDTAGRESADQWVSQYGPLFRLITTFAEDGTPELRVSRPIGNLPGAIAEGDDWVEGEYRKLLFTRAEVDADTQDRLELRWTP